MEQLIAERNKYLAVTLIYGLAIGAWFALKT